MKFKIHKITVNINFFFIAALSVMLILRDNKLILSAVAAAVLHECGHIAALLLMNNNIKELKISVSGIELKQGTKFNLSFKGEIISALAGVFVNFMCAQSFLLVNRARPNDFFLYNAGIHLVLGLFNLLPVKALDGGRALYYLLCIHMEQDRAERILKLVSVVTAIILFVLGIILFVRARNASLLITSVFLLVSSK